MLEKYTRLTKHDSTIFPVDSYDNWYFPSRVFDTEDEANEAKKKLENI